MNIINFTFSLLSLGVPPPFWNPGSAPAVCACILFAAKPVDNLALQVFRRYHAELSRALSGFPDEVAAELYSAGLITLHDKSQAVDTLGLTPFRKADSLMEAVERRIVTENSAAPLKNFAVCSGEAMV